MTFSRARAVLTALARRARARATGEEGVALIEIVVSALLLAMIVVGMFSAFDSAGRFSSQEQIRAQANSLAQQDEDRLRGLQISQLSGLNQARTVTLNNTVFTVTSTASFVSDSTGTSSCAQSGTADYIQTKSSVTWPSIGSRPPVTAEGIVTPNAGGSLIVDVTDHNGNGVAGVTVSATGASTMSGTTSSSGCAIFGGATPGSYTVSISDPGYIDPNGNSSPQQSTTVVGQATTSVPFTFDQASTISVTFDTKYSGVVHPSGDNTTLVLHNNGISYPGNRWAGTNNTYNTTVTQSNVFPFSSAYQLYAGSCTSGSSNSLGDEPSSFSQTDATAAVTPGQTTNVVVHLPALLVTVYSGSYSSPGAVVSKPHVVLYDWYCGGSPPVYCSSTCSSGQGTPNIEWAPATTTSGTLVDPGQPYGDYMVCADSGGKLTLLWLVVNNDPVNGVQAKLYMQGGYPNNSGMTSSGTCP